MRPRPHTGRKIVNVVAVSVATVLALFGVIVLLCILLTVFHRGFSSFDWNFFTKASVPPGVEGGGLANAMFGTLILTTLGALASIPPGILTGIYLSEFAAGGRFASAVRFSVNVLMGIPSLVVGLAVWGSIVVATGTFSAWAGAVSLAIIMVPVVAGTTEDMLKLVPDTLRESAVAMGAPRWKVMYIIFLTAKSGLITGVLLATARATGETAPLLFTALNSPYWPSTLSAPTANLPVTIFNYAMCPYGDWQAKAWGASLVITAAVLLLSVGARILFREAKKS